MLIECLWFYSRAITASHESKCKCLSRSQEAEAASKIAKKTKNAVTALRFLIVKFHRRLMRNKWF